MNNDKERDENVDKLLENKPKDWRVYNATKRYELNPDEIKWFYPLEERKNTRVRFEGDDENFYYNYDEKDGAAGSPRYRIDDHAITLSNIKVLDKHVEKIVPEDSYFEPGELAIIESHYNPFRAPCRHVFGLFTRMAYFLIFF